MSDDRFFRFFTNSELRGSPVANLKRLTLANATQVIVCHNQRRDMHLVIQCCLIKLKLAKFSSKLFKLRG